MKNNTVKIILILAAIIIGLLIWWAFREDGYGEGFVSGNGRIEATEIDVSTKLAGRLQDISVEEGDFVKEGQLLAVIQTDTLKAQLREAKAQHQQAIASKSTAESQLALRRSDKEAAMAAVSQRKSEMDSAQRKLNRTETLVKSGAISVQDYDDDATKLEGAHAALTAARAQVSVTEAAIQAARSDILAAESNAKAAEATVARIQADIDDCQLIAPRAGRIQFRIAQKGEVLGAGGKVMNLVDLSDVYMTFFLPEEVAGKVALGSDVHIVLDSVPDKVIPAKVSFVASVAQFTPKTVETENERQKLMFRIKARIDPELLQKFITQVKTGVPGVAWIKLNDRDAWPQGLQVDPQWLSHGQYNR